MSASVTSSTPTVREWVGRHRLVLAAGAVVLLASLVLALIQLQPSGERYDPDGVAPDASRAVAEVLRGQGVPVERVVGVEAARRIARQGDLVLVADPAQTSATRLASLTGVSFVLIDATDPAMLTAVLPGAAVTGVADVEVRDPECDLRAAQQAGDARTGGTTYSFGGDAAAVWSCYDAEATSVLQVTRFDAAAGDPSVTLLGTGAFLTNEHLAENGNAALALNLLGSRDRVVWVMPSSAELRADNGSVSPWDLLPAWVWALLLQLVIGVVVLALWRARRLGPVVVEPLPVVVRSAEATEGRARLYARSRAVARSGATLQEATRVRLAHRLGLSDRAALEVDSRQALLAAVSGRTGRDSDEVQMLLYGVTPNRESDLVRLADQLDSLEAEVRGS